MFCFIAGWIIQDSVLAYCSLDGPGFRFGILLTGWSGIRFCQLRFLSGVQLCQCRKCRQDLMLLALCRQYLAVHIAANVFCHIALAGCHDI